MKTRSILLGIASLAAGLSSALAQTAVTDPVGYVTSTLVPNSVGGGGSDTIIAPTLVQKIEFSGASSAAPSGTSITFASGVPVIAAGDAGKYYVEIKSGANAGWWSTLSGATTATSVGVTDTLPAGLASGTTFNIRRHNTLATWLGANSAGLTTVEQDAAKPDRILILDPVSQSVAQYVYSTINLGGTPGFYNEVTEAPANDLVLVPGTAVIVRQLSTASKSVVSVGHVKLTPTQIDIYKGDNIVEPMLATGTTLATSGLDTGSGLTGLYREDYNAANGAPDRALFVTSLQAVEQFVALAAILPAHNFINEVTEIDANGKVISEGTGFILRRDTAAGINDGVWTTPAQVVN